MNKSYVAHSLCVLTLIGCGADRNAQLVNPNVTSSEPTNDENSLGIDGINASVSGQRDSLTGRVSAALQIESYVRFKQANGVECTGVLAYEPASGATEMVDVYLYSALHCLQETNPLGYLKNANPQITEAYAYRVGGPLTTPLATTLITDSKTIHVMKNGQYPADVVRIWQFRAPLQEVAQRAYPVCTNRLSDSTPEDVAALGFYIEKGNPFAVVPSPYSWHSVSNQFQHKLISAALTQVSTRTERLKTKLQQFFGAGNALTVSPYLLKLGETSSQPGESGSPVYSVTTQIKNNMDAAQNQLKVGEPVKEISQYKCLSGVLAREVAQRVESSSNGSSQLMYDTYFSPFRDAADRAWLSFDGKEDVTRTFVPPANLLAARTFKSLRTVDISKNPLGHWSDGELYSDLLAGFHLELPTNASDSQTVIRKKIEGLEKNINVETLFGSDAFKSNVRKVVQIEASATVSSTSTQIPALIVPAGSGGMIVIRNFGKILGKAGAFGVKGGDALHVRSPTRILNYGLISGGGTGGQLGFAIRGSKLINGRLTVGSRCRSLESMMGEMIGPQRDTVSNDDLSRLSCL